MTREELIALRREATRWIRKLELLDGFSARRNGLEPIPTAVSHLEWSTIVGYVSSEPRAGLVWDWVPEASATHLGGTANLGKFSRRVRGGQVEYLLPATESVPRDNDTLEAIARYRVSVEEFAKEFLANETWAFEAVHRAVRDDRPLRLPPLPAGPSVTAPARLQIDVQPGDTIPYDTVVVLRQFAKLVDEPELVAELGRRERSRTWEGWLSAMQKRLTNAATTPTERGNVSDARRYLHAAATGVLISDKRR
jgi:hypothetical protein